MPIYRVDFHHHVKGDPIDCLNYTIFDLIDCALKKGIHSIAVTPHGKVFQDQEAIEYATRKGILLISGVEKRVEGREVLILNVTPEEIPSKMTFTDLRLLREKKGDQILIVAPHPFYPARSCLLSKLEEYHSLFDATEYAHLHLSFYNPNEKAVAWAQRHQKAILANSDTHGLFMLGKNYSEVEAESLTTDSIFRAIRNHRLKPRVHVPSILELVRFTIEVTLLQAVYRRVIPSRRRASQLSQSE